MSDKDKSTDDIRQELLEMGIDYHSQVDWCTAVSHVDAYYEKTIAIRTDDAISPHLRKWAAGQFENSDLSPEEVSRRLWRMFSTLLGTFLVFCVSTAILLFDVVVSEAWLFVAQAALLVSVLLAIIATLVAMQLLWAAYVRERSLRYEAVENLRLARDLLHAGC